MCCGRCKWTSTAGKKSAFTIKKGESMTTPERYTVIGAGHGGKAMAAHLALMGLKVNLYNRTFEHIQIIKVRGGIDLDSGEAVLRGFGRMNLVTSDMREALEGAQMIMVVVPSSAHVDVAKTAAPFLKDGQTVILHPGRTCGAIEFAKTLKDSGCTSDVTIAEAETFIYASRSDGPNQARIFRIKEAVPLAALPAFRTRAVLDALNPVYPQFIDGVNVLHTGLNNMTAQHGLDRSYAWRLSVLHRWCDTFGCTCAGSTRP
jgi:opine dehydrogenase